DATFGTGGKVVTAFGTGIDAAQDVILQPDGKLVVAGRAKIGTISQFALARYLTNGALDPSFGLGGEVTTQLGAGDPLASSLARQPDGKFVVAGRARTGSDMDFAVARSPPAGALAAACGRW